MMGMGTGMMKHVMKQKGVATLPELHSNRLKAWGLNSLTPSCEMAMNVCWAFKNLELIEGIEIASA